MLPSLGKWLIGLGALLLGVGAWLYFSPYLSKVPGLKLLGRLPGDIHIQRENFRFYFPLATSIVVSVLLNLVLLLIRWLKK